MTAIAPATPAVKATPATPPTAGPWRSWRVPLAIVVLILIGAAAVALLQPGPAARGYLDPAGDGPMGAHALAAILVQRGEQVIRTTDPAAAQAAAAAGGTTLLVTSPQYLTGRQLSALALVRGNRVIVAPDGAVLAALAPAVTLAGAAPVGPVQPDCDLAAALLAGNADMGGVILKPQPGAAGAAGLTGGAQCYFAGGLPSLVRYAAAGRTITVLGTGAPLTNGHLDQLGNAALAIDLLTARARIVWLVPTAPALPAGPSGSQQSLISLIPLGTYLIALQLGIAVLLAAVWRARRLGPLVPEQLPVVIRAAETVEGHARLYQSRRARGSAAAALRSATLSRLYPAAGLPSGALPAAVTAALATRCGLSAATIEMMLFGPAPGSDAQLVTLADDLDALEREVRAQ